MPLSEHEQRQFEAIERALYNDDPKFAHAVRRRDPVVAGRRRLGIGVLVIALGLATLLTGVIGGLWYVGVAGFLVMVGGALLGAAGVRRMTGRTGGERQPTATGPGSVTAITARRRQRRALRGPDGSGRFGRLEERWHRRMGDQG